MGRLRGLPPRIGSAEPKLGLAPKQADPFYTSPEWRRLAAQLKRERGGCEELIEVHGVTARCGSTDRLIADHEVERKDGGAELDPANVKLRCFTHHQRKTAEARRRRARGQASEGAAPRRRGASPPQGGQKV